MDPAIGPASPEPHDAPERRTMKYGITPMGAGHHDAVLRLWRENMAALQGSDLLDQRFQWLYGQNPDGAAETLLATDEATGEVVGCATVFPRRLRINGVDVTGGVPVDFSVTRAHRSGAAALRIQRALISDVSPAFGVLYGFPNKSALPILQRVGYTPFAGARAWIKPLFANYRLVKYLKLRALAALAAQPINLYLAAADARRARKGRRDVRHEFTDRADDRFDALWTRARQSYVVTGHRTSDYLNWRYAAFPTTRYKFFCLLSAGTGELLGYVAFSIRNNKAYVGDLFAADMSALGEDLLVAFSRALRRQGIDSIFLGYAGNPAFEHVLGRVGFIARPGYQRQMVLLTRDVTADQRTVLLDARSWYLFDGEMDI